MTLGDLSTPTLAPSRGANVVQPSPPRLARRANLGCPTSGVGRRSAREIWGTVRWDFMGGVSVLRGGRGGDALSVDMVGSRVAGGGRRGRSRSGIRSCSRQLARDVATRINGDGYPATPDGRRTSTAAQYADVAAPHRVRPTANAVVVIGSCGDRYANAIMVEWIRS
jgi:hypothetical protein